jgi:hypothetical protein
MEPLRSFRTSGEAAPIRNPSKSVELYDGFRVFAALRPE